MKAVLSLGSNLGDRLQNINNAIAALSSADMIMIEAVSPVYETEPVDVPDEFRDAPYLNAVVIVDSCLTAQGLSDTVHAIEATLGRERGGRHAPRVIDIDIVSFGGIIHEAPALRLPHPEAASRRFVLRPLADIAPDYILPGQEKTVQQLLAALPSGQHVRKIAAQLDIISLCRRTNQ